MTLEAGTPRISTSGDQEQKELMRQERAIARKYMGNFPLAMAIWGLCNLVCWLALWPLVFTGILPLWAACPIATVNVILCYLPSHEAQHSNFGRPGDRLWWLNELIGYLSTIPLVLPFKIARLTHLEHHRHTNDPDLDPDYGAHAATWWRAILTGIKRRQPGQPDSYAIAIRRLGGNPLVNRAALEGALQNLSYWVILAVLAWTGWKRR